jgi:hypothetical protein
MTLSPAEIGLSPEAAARLDDYLRQVRAALSGAADVNPDEIEADIREHVENELRGGPRPVPLTALEAVLARLGPPSQWGTGDDPNFLHRARHLLRERLRGAKATLAERLRTARTTLWRGPEDWRLAYLSFGIFALGIVTFFALFPVTLLVSYFLSRAGIASAKGQGITLDPARKWLLYPPVVIVSLALLIAVVAWPVALGVWAGGEVDSAVWRVEYYNASDPKPPAGSYWTRLSEWEARRSTREGMASQVEKDRKLLAAIPVSSDWKPVVAGLFAGAGAAALWWMILGVAAASYPGAARAVFFPLCNRLERRHGLALAVACLVVLIPWSLTAYEVVKGVV